MSEKVLSLKDIVMEYGSDRILDSASVDVYAGETLGIKGKNGAGKSTLLGIMSGIIKPKSGERIECTDLKGLISYVPQDIALYPALTGRQNLDFWAEAYGLYGKRKRSRVDFLLEVMKLTEKKNKRVETYSGGMKRRLNMAAALVITPKLLLLDEPTVGADAESVKTMLEFVGRMKKGGTAVVLISHIGDDLAFACDRVITLSDGRIV